MIDELDGSGLDEVLETEDRAVLVQFWGPWCAPCRALKPHIAKMAEEYPNLLDYLKEKLPRTLARTSIEGDCQNQIAAAANGSLFQQES